MKTDIQDEEHLIHREQEHSACKNYIPVEILRHPVCKKLDVLVNNKLLFEKDSTMYPVMYKIHKDLGGAKNLYFYIKRKDGRYLLVKHEHKLNLVFRKYKNSEGFLTIYYHNDMLSRSKVLDYCFVFAQVVIVVYLFLFIYGYLRSHDYI